MCTSLGCGWRKEGAISVRVLVGMCAVTDRGGQEEQAGVNAGGWANTPMCVQQQELPAAWQRPSYQGPAATPQSTQEGTHPRAPLAQTAPTQAPR